MSAYIHNDRLFSAAYFERVINERAFPFERRMPGDADERLRTLLGIWESVRERLVAPIFASDGNIGPFVGLPAGLRPIAGVAESVTEQDFVRRVLHEVLGYSTENNRTLQGERGETFRPDVVCFPDEATHRAAVSAADAKKRADARQFCAKALLILDAKRFDKGVGADEEHRSGDTARRSKQEKKAKDTSAIDDIQQVHNYLRECGKSWGVLTNGRSWRLMRAGTPDPFAHLRFDLVAFLESLRGREITDDDRKTFSLFYWLFGLPAVSAGYLDTLARESEAETRKVRDVLRDQAHEAVRIIVNGFFKHERNELPQQPSQDELDRIRELALIFLYRLLFILKAEAQNLLPMLDERGARTRYAEYASTAAIFKAVQAIDEADRSATQNAFRMLQDLFALIDKGGQYDVPAYNGGLFDREKHAKLDQLWLHDDVVYHLLRTLIYLGDDKTPVRYADLDVRDFGDIYEGLLGKRLVAETVDGRTQYVLRSEKGDKKASGSYFTPDSIVDHVVRKTLEPLLARAGDDPEKVLALRIVDPAMGSGHFLVKVVDVMAWHLTMHCDPLDPDAPNDNGPEELAYWRRKVVESCIYGVDFNPMAVELAKVALWLHTAARGKPLSFLDHHLKCGNSLVFARLAWLKEPGLKAKKTRKGIVWEPVAREETKIERDEEEPKASTRKRKTKTPNGQLRLPFRIDTNLVSGILRSVRDLLARPSDRPSDVKEKGRRYMAEVEGRLAAHRLLADLWCMQWFLDDPDAEVVRAYEDPDAGIYAQLKAVCGLPNDRQRQAELEKLMDHPLVQRVLRARGEGYGPRLLRFFHWELEFPEVAFDESGKLRDSLGFDAVVGNPPWDKIKPAKRDFYGPFHEEVPNTQGPSRDRLIARIEAERPWLREGWEEYERRQLAYARYLAKSTVFTHQVTTVEGKRTGGDPDVFRYFVELGWLLLSPRGNGGLVVPSTLWQAEGCTALRKLLFEKATLTGLFTFENYRKWAFDIDSRFKFTVFTFAKQPPPANHELPAAFMLRDARVFEGKAQERLLPLTIDYVRATSPATLALLDVRNALEASLVKRLHEEHPALGSKKSGWAVTYRRELDMTNDAWLFKTREWMRDRGFTRVLPVRAEDGSWKQEIEGPGRVAGIPADLPEGGEYWVAASEEYYRGRGYVERQGELRGKQVTWFLKPEDVGKNEAANRIFPGQRYTALYDGRLLHSFDHVYQRYLSGEGPRQRWQKLSFDQKMFAPRVFVNCDEAGIGSDVRVGFRDIARGTDERTLIAALVPSGVGCGNKIPVLRLERRNQVSLLAVLGSLVADYLVRLRVGATVNWVYLGALAVPKPTAVVEAVRFERLEETVARLSCTTPELADVWNEVFRKEPWTYASAERDPVKRAELRAELDAIVAELYGLTVPEYAYVLSTFPLLDRDQPALPGDKFVTEGDERSRKSAEERGETWDELPDGTIVELSPRSFITRDLALLTYMKRVKYPIPEDLGAFYRDEVGLDPDGPLSRFRIGKIRDLGERVLAARELGAVAYVPSGKGGGEEEGEE